MTFITEKDFLSVTEVSKILRKTNERISSLCRAGKFKGAKKVGSYWIIPSKEVETFTEVKRGPKRKISQKMYIQNVLKTLKEQEEENAQKKQETTPETESEKLISVMEASEKLKLDRTSIARLCRQGYIKGATKIGKHWVIPEEAVKTFIKLKPGVKPKVKISDSDLDVPDTVIETPEQESD